MEFYSPRQFSPQTLRALWRDYNTGLFFVTICTYKKWNFFGEIHDNELYLSEIGRYAEDCVKKIEELHKRVSVPAFQVMPNHVHIIVAIHSKQDYGGAKELLLDDVRTFDSEDVRETTKGPKNAKMQSVALLSGRLSILIAQMKRAVTVYANSNDIPFGWQTGFYDRVIKDVKDLEAVTNYINNNVANWKEDHYNISTEAR